MAVIAFYIIVGVILGLRGNMKSMEDDDSGDGSNARPITSIGIEIEP